MTTTREYIQAAAQDYWDREFPGTAPRTYDVLAPESAPFPHLVILQLSRQHEHGIEGSWTLWDTYRLDFRGQGDTIDQAEAARLAVVARLHAGGRLAREGPIIDLVEGTLTVFQRNAAETLDRESSVYRRVQEVDIE